MTMQEQLHGPLDIQSSYFPPTPRARPRSLLPEPQSIPRSLPRPEQERAQLQTSLSSYSLAAPLDTEWTFPAAIAAGKASRRHSQAEVPQSPRSRPITPGLELANPFEQAYSANDGAHSRSWSDPTILASTAGQSSKPVMEDQRAIEQQRQEQEDRWQDEPDAEMEYDFEKEFKALGLELHPADRAPSPNRSPEQNTSLPNLPPREPTDQQNVDYLKTSLRRLAMSSIEPPPRSPSPTSSLSSTISRRSSIAHSGEKRRRPSVTSNRRGSIVSIAGLSDLGSSALHALTPALSSTSVSVLIESKPEEDLLATSDSGHGLPQPLEPTPSPPIRRGRPMMRLPSENRSLPFHFPSHPGTPTERDDVFSSSLMSRQTTSSSYLEPEEVDQNPLYLVLSTSSATKEAWSRAGLVLVPNRETLPSEEVLRSEDDYVASHAFERSAGEWVSLGSESTGLRIRDGVAVLLERGRRTASAPTPKTARPNLQRGTSEVPFPSSERLSMDEDEILLPYTAGRELRIISETMVYRRSPHPQPAPAATEIREEKTIKPKSSFSKLRPSKSWFRAPSFSTSKSSTTLLVNELKPPMKEAPLERLRVLNVDGPVRPWKSEQQVEVVQRLEIPSRRDVLSDLDFLLEPPVPFTDRHAFEGALREIALLTHRFANSFVYVKGYELYTAQRIRRGILDKVYSDLAPYMEADPMLFQLIENVTMGFLHQKIYAVSLLPLFVTENQRLNIIIATYNERRLDLTSFGVRLLGHIDFPKAVSLVKQLSGSNDDDDGPASLSHIALQKLYQVTQSIPAGDTVVPALLDARTPFDCITLIRLAIDELVNQVSEGNESGHMRNTSTDELIPLLAYTIVAAGALDLESMLFYIHNFTQDALGPEYQWSLATFQAAISYLRTDPFQALTEKQQQALAPAHAQPIKRPSPVIRRHTEDGSPSPVNRLSVRWAASTSPTLSRNNSFTSVEDDSALATARPFSQSSASLDQLNRERKNSLAARRAMAHKHIPPELEEPQQDALQMRSRHRSDVSLRSMASAKSQEESLEMPPPTLPIRRSCDDPDQQRIRNRMSLDSSTLTRMNYGRKSFESEASDSNESAPSRSPELSIRPQIYLRASHRGPHRSFHTSDDFGSSHAFDDFGGSSMHKSSSSISSRQLGSSTNSQDMRRAGSDNNGGKRMSMDSWTSLFTTGRAPASDESFSPRSSSPSSNNHALTLERTTSLSSAQEGESWWGRSRRRLSSVTSQESMTSNQESTSCYSGSDQVKASARTRKNSDAAAVILTQGRRPSIQADSSTASGSAHTNRLTQSTRARPLSLISISSMSSDDQGSLHSDTTSTSMSPTVPRARRRHRTSRLRRDLLSSGAALPLLDTNSALSFSSSSFFPAHSPIKEGFTAPHSPTLLVDLSHS